MGLYIGIDTFMQSLIIYYVFVQTLLGIFPLAIILVHILNKYEERKFTFLVLFWLIRNRCSPLGWKKKLKKVYHKENVSFSNRLIQLLIWSNTKIKATKYYFSLIPDPSKYGNEFQNINLILLAQELD